MLADQGERIDNTKEDNGWRKQKEPNPDLKEIQRKLTARASYQKMLAAKEGGKPICVASAGIPNEVMYAMDVYPIFPESLAAISAGIGKAGPFFDEARDRGYTNTVCSYTRCGLGIAWTNRVRLRTRPGPRPFYHRRKRLLPSRELVGLPRGPLQETHLFHGHAGHR